MRRPGRFWLAFVAAFAGVGGAVDLWADGNDVPGDTFSEQWRALGIPDWALAFGLCGVGAGLFVHLKQRPHEGSQRVTPGVA